MNRNYAIDESTVARSYSRSLENHTLQLMSYAGLPEELTVIDGISTPLSLPSIRARIAPLHLAPNRPPQFDAQAVVQLAVIRWQVHPAATGQTLDQVNGVLAAMAAAGRTELL